MAEETLQQILAEMSSRIQAELEGQVQALQASQAEAVVRARQDAEAEAEKRWTARVEAVRSEWSARLESEIAAARAEAEKRLVAETMRIRSEADQAGFAREREEVERDAREHEMTAGTSPGVATSVLRAMRTIDGAGSLSDTLTILATTAMQHAPRAALFVLNGTWLEEWPAPGADPLSRHPVDVAQSGLLGAALTRGERVAAPDDGAAPAFAQLPEGRGASAVPILMDWQPVGVLYADEGASGAGHDQQGWANAVEVLARHAAARLAQVTAVRSLQLLQGGDAKGPTPHAAVDEEQSARRYAKLLVSEIKLYNEGAVRVGRERRDLLQRLKAEIDRARRLYEERVSPTVAARGSYFEQELVQTLAGGDHALLGS